MAQHTIKRSCDWGAQRKSLGDYGQHDLPLPISTTQFNKACNAIRCDAAIPLEVVAHTRAERWKLAGGKRLKGLKTLIPGFKKVQMRGGENRRAGVLLIVGARRRANEAGGLLKACRLYMMRCHETRSQAPNQGIPESSGLAPGAVFLEAIS